MGAVKSEDELVEQMMTPGGGYSIFPSGVKILRGLVFGKQDFREEVNDMIHKNLNERFVSPVDMGVKIKQLLPIPDYLTLMVVDIDEANNEFLREYKDLFWPYLLALIEYEDGKTAVAPYSIDQDCIDMDAEIMGKRTCPKCGAEMTIVDRNHSRSIRYYCSECDYSDEGIPDN